MSGIGAVLAVVVPFTLLILALVFIVLAARSQLVAVGSVNLSINDEPDKALTVPVAGKLLNVLSERKIFLPSACGGGGTCGECRVVVRGGGGDPLPTERSKLNRGQLRQGYRLSCQLTVKRDLSLEIPPEFFEIRKWECAVRSNRNVATFIKELVLELPAGT